MPDPRETPVHIRKQADAASCTNVPHLVDALEKVLKVHKERRYSRWAGEVFCSECRRGAGRLVSYPCPTVAVITRALAVITRALKEARND